MTLQHISNDSQTIALKRFATIAPLLDQVLSDPDRAKIRTEILQKENISDRTLRRWIQTYHSQGFDGLYPKERKDKGVPKAMSKEALELATLCRTDLPRRSAEVIQSILKAEGHTVTRSTLERQLRQNGFSSTTLKKEAAQSGQGRRFVRDHRNDLWQTDIKYGPYIWDCKNPDKKIKSYLLIIIDDATRMVVHGEFYDSQKQPILEDGLRKALLRCGTPKRFYCDNGKIFISDIIKQACARLGVHHINTKAYSPESKGKVERFNRTVESFFDEVRLEGTKSLEELNRLFAVWLSEWYHHRPHKGLNKETPANAFAKDTSAIRFASYEDLREAFLKEEIRTVDKSGCFQLNGCTYEAGMAFLRKKIIVRYDNLDLDEIEIWKDGKKVQTARKWIANTHNATIEKPVKTLEKAGTSRMLKHLETASKKRMNARLGAYSLDVK